VHERPAGIRDSDVGAALARQWALTAQDVSYLPVGFGGYHWLAVDQTGSRWFVTVSDLTAPWMLDLPAAMRTAGWLATEAGLEFVVAPVPTIADEVVGSLDSRHALTLFAYVEATPARFEDPIDDADRAAIIDMAVEQAQRDRHPVSLGSAGPRAIVHRGCRAQSPRQVG
jgi:spectinomycin phosphotransferase